MAMRQNGVYEFPYMSKQQQLTKWQTFKYGIWNPNTKELFGRNAGSWARILIFYICFYAVLAALVSIFLAALYATLDKDRPTYTNDDSIMRGNPGLGYRPMDDDELNNPLIKYNLTKKTQIKHIEQLDAFFKIYNETLDVGSKITFYPHCNYTSRPENGLACDVNLNFSSCAGPNYGYEENASPCVFLKLNKIYNWVPEYYNDSKDLPDNMPPDLVKVIKIDEMKKESNKVWVSCKGESPTDKEHIARFNYYPYRGFPSFYYPFNHSKEEYLSPIIAVEVLNPKSGVPVNVECRAWAKNIEYESGPPLHRRGSVRFEIFKED